MPSLPSSLSLSPVVQARLHDQAALEDWARLNERDNEAFAEKIADIHTLLSQRELDVDTVRLAAKWCRERGLDVMGDYYDDVAKVAGEMGARERWEFLGRLRSLAS